MNKGTESEELETEPATRTRSQLIGPPTALDCDLASIRSDT